MRDDSLYRRKVAQRLFNLNKLGPSLIALVLCLTAFSGCAALDSGNAIGKVNEFFGSVPTVEETEVIMDEAEEKAHGAITNVGHMFRNLFRMGYNVMTFGTGKGEELTGIIRDIPSTFNFVNGLVGFATGGG